MALENKNNLKEFLNEISKKYKARIIDEKTFKDDFFSTGSLLINQIIGGKGYPKRRIIEIFGQPGTGKTTLAIHAMQEIQKVDKRSVAYFDIERTLNINYVKKIGVETNRMVLLHPKNAEETFNLLIEFLESENFSLIVIDSVAALLPESEAKEKMEKSTIGLQARIMSKALRKLNHLLTEKKGTLIFINQIREKIKIMFGNPETTSGGNALRFYASLRIELRRKTKIIQNEKEIGIYSRIKVVKNKSGSPFSNGEIGIYYGTGFSFVEEVMRLGIAKNIIERKGSWFWYNQKRLECGFEKTKFLLKQDKILVKKIAEQINLIYLKEKENK